MIGWPDPQFATHEVGMLAYAALNVEAFLHERIGDAALGLDFLKSELAEAEETIDQLLREHAARLDVGDDFFLQRIKPRIGRGRAGEGWIAASLAAPRRAGQAPLAPAM